MLQTEKCDHIHLVYRLVVSLTKCDYQHVPMMILKVDSAWKSLKSQEFLTAAVANIQPSLFSFVCLSSC